MNQQQFDVIIAIIRNGAPALANELVEAMINLINENNELKKKIENITAEQSDTAEKEG